MKKGHKKSFSQFIKDLIMMYEKGPAHQMRVINLQVLKKECSIEKRRLSDLFSVLSALNVCTKIEAQSYHWNSVNNIEPAISQICKNLELRAAKVPFETLFEAGPSPPIGELTVKLIEIFLFFGEPKMSLNLAARLLAMNRERVKRVLRRVYLAAYFLEQFDIIAHSDERGIYIFKLDLADIIKKVYYEIQKNEQFNFSILGLLNRVDDSYILAKKIQRKTILNSCFIKLDDFNPVVPEVTYNSIRYAGNYSP